MSDQEILKELSEIKNLLNELLNKEKEKEKPKTPKQRNNIFIKSKYLNEEQQKQILEYIENEETKNIIAKLPKHTQVSYVRKELKEKYNINLSIYMTDKLINKLNI
ncbi:hypothetical protein M9Y10_040115 [Tritrichomonas musculus]|uniref:Uncharacterized protein n=1 Tax=Tritrichomonas musculus TaxID=1915356 RepID=A0ABR2GQ36_9EUKA